MRPINIKIPLLFRRGLFILLGSSLISGLGFYIFSHWITIDGDFGPEKHPWQFPLLQIHGACAFLMMMAYGALLANHAPSGWRLKRLRGWGLTLVSVIVLQIVTAYSLYYLANEQLREWLANAHTLLGLSMPFLLFGHIKAGKKNLVQSNLQQVQELSS